ncbi:hypothetical protein [Pandoraea faecigallinarum]|nr:hypothetical protein [Pandoraea faecigallinarum]
MWYQQCAGASGWGPDWGMGVRDRPDVAVELAGMREAAAYRRAERCDLGTRLAHVSNSLSNAQRNGVARASATRRVAPELARAFAAAWAQLWVTTGSCQHFYRNEFELAHARDARLAQGRTAAAAMLAPTCAARAASRQNAHDVQEASNTPDAPDVPDTSDLCVERICAEVASWLETIAATGRRGWHFRAARDAMSLVGNLSLLGIVAAYFHHASEGTADTEHDRVHDMAAVNTPFGIAWADWTLLGFEGLKGLLTQSLGSPTLIRHHAVDEVLKRMDAGCRLLEACVMLPSAADTSSWRGTLGRLTHSRDVATLFTFANSAVPPARLGLWMPSWFSEASTTFDGYRGILRVAGLMLDSCRAVTSLLGTWARNEAFAHDADRLAHRWEALYARLALVPAQDVAKILERVAHVTQLARHCDTPLLAKIASHRTLCECLLASHRSLTASQIAVVCDEFDLSCHASCVDGLNYLSLDPAENPWGQRWIGDAWRSDGATPARVSYRLLLMYQHWSAALLERVLGAAPGEASADTDATSVDLQSTWI